MAAMADLWFAVSPRWAAAIGASYLVHDPAGVSTSELFVTLGVARLFWLRKTFGH